MPQPQHLDPSAYAADGGPVGVLLVHGLPGSAAETRPMGEYLAAQGLTVRCPLLTGHGRTESDLFRVRWQQWVADVERELGDLQHRCDQIFAGGLSLGAVLALLLGARHPDLGGLIAMAPAVKVRSRLAPLSVVFRYFLTYVPSALTDEDDLGDPEAIQRIWCYDRLAMQAAAQFYLLQRRVSRLLPSIRQPLLIFQGLRDTQVPPEAARFLYERVASTDRTLIWLENSGHNLLADGERRAVWAQSYEWIMDRPSRSDSP
jgi:carboxylesterase